MAVHIDKLTSRDLTQRISLIGLSLTPDNYGAYTEQWVHLHNCWSKLFPLTKVEALRIDPNQGEVLDPLSLKYTPTYYKLITQAHISLPTPLRIRWRHKLFIMISEPELSANQQFQSSICQKLPDNSN